MKVYLRAAMNVALALKLRGFSVGGGWTEGDEDEAAVLRDFQSTGHVEVIGTRPGRGRAIEKAVYVILDASQAPARHKNDFESLMNSVLSKNKKDLHELVLVSTAEVLAKKNIIECFLAIKGPAFLLPVPLVVFANPIVNHCMAAKHEIVAKKDIDIGEWLHLQSSNYPSIGLIEPQVVWAGGRPGDFLKVTRMSENAGTVPTYFHVV